MHIVKKKRQINRPKKIIFYIKSMVVWPDFYILFIKINHLNGEYIFLKVVE